MRGRLFRVVLFVAVVLCTFLTPGDTNAACSGGQTCHACFDLVCWETCDGNDICRELRRGGGCVAWGACQSVP